jgi:hypothetical protein
MVLHTPKLETGRPRTHLVSDASTKREREGKEDLEMEVRRIRMVMEQETNADERLDDIVSSKRRLKE